VLEATSKLAQSLRDRLFQSEDRPMFQTNIYFDSDGSCCSWSVSE
jgi:hypothetical protein